MTRLRFTNGFLAIALLTTMPLSGSANGQVTSAIEADKHRLLVAAVARCIVKGREAFFRRVVRAGDETALFPRADDGARAGDCYAKVSGNISGERITAALGWLAPIADELVQIDFAQSSSFSFAPAPALTYTLYGEDDTKASKPTSAQIARLAKRQRTLVKLAFGECVSRSQPSAVYKVLRTEVASYAESSAMAALNSSFDRCTAGTDFTLSLEDMRAALALSFYRLASASAGISGGIYPATHGALA